MVTWSWAVLTSRSVRPLCVFTNLWLMTARLQRLSRHTLLYFSHCFCLQQFRDWRRHNVLDLSVRPFVCYQTCEHDMLKTNEPNLLQIGTSGPWGRGMIRDTRLWKKHKKVRECVHSFRCHARTWQTDWQRGRQTCTAQRHTLRIASRGKISMIKLFILMP